MTLFELIKQEVTAREVAELYGMRISRNKGYCPWHNDRHPSLHFYPDGGCYCFVCNRAGDATDVAAALLGVSGVAAAEQIRRDFQLNQPVDKRPDVKKIAARKRKKTEYEKKCERYAYLCDVIREADARLAQYTPETADAEFDVILAAKGKAETEMYCLFEELAG